MQKIIKISKCNDGLSGKVISEFSRLCGWAHATWSFYQGICNHPQRSMLARTSFWELLGNICQEHYMLQIVKLHDPAVQSGRINLTLDYIITYGNWDPETRSNLEGLKSELDGLLLKPLKPARNKIISHNDLETILAGDPIGQFDGDEDKEYFEKLQKFIDLVHNKSRFKPSYGNSLGSYQFSNAGNKQAIDFVDALHRSLPLSKTENS
jgi:hypothetical protein